MGSNLIFGPLLLARYSFKLYMDMRNLHISTIQTLTKTIEAKIHILVDMLLE